MERIVVLVEYGGGMFDGIQGQIVLRVPEGVNLETMFGRPVWKASELREPQAARAFAASLKAVGAEELPVEWIVIH